MTLVEAIASIQTQRDLSEDERRQRTYALKANALLNVIERDKAIAHTPPGGSKYTFRINDARMVDGERLFLDVTFARGPTAVTHQITITNPPVLPRERTGNERDDLITAISEMLEGFV